MTWERSLPALLQIVAGGSLPAGIASASRRGEMQVVDFTAAESPRREHEARVASGMGEARQIVGGLLEGQQVATPASEPAAV